MDTKKSTIAELDVARAAVGVRALDDLSLEFTLDTPLAAFSQATALWVGSPVRLEDLGTPPLNVYRPVGLTKLIGNGPFVLKDWIRGDRLIFDRNDHYRLPVRLSRWTKRIVPDAETQRAIYEVGGIDLVAVVPRDDADREALLARRDMDRMLGSCTRYVGFNMDRPPFDDANVRLAFAKALDKEDYARSIETTGRPAASLIVHAQPGHAHDDRVQQFDPVEARRLLAASKYGAPVDGKIGGIDLRFAFTASPSNRNAGRVKWIVGQWFASLVVTVQLDPIDTTTFGGGWGGRFGAQPQLYLNGWCEDYPDGQAWDSVLFRSSSAAQRTHFNDKGFDALVDQADLERDPLTRQALYERASRILSTAAPGAWLTWSETWWLVRPELRGYEQSSFDWDFAQFSLARIVGVRR
jgi:ABC-type transport system substrate-binding protein